MSALLGLFSTLVLAPPQQEQPPAMLPEVVVQGDRVRDAARDFVDRITAPATGRGLARWRGPVCAGTVNLRADVAQPILDRLGETAARLGIEVGSPGCSPNLVVIFADNGAATATRLVENDPRLFRVGVSGFDRGPQALRRFQTSEAPVRWWALSMPVDPVTGERRARAPGDVGGGSIPADLAESLGCPNGGCSTTDSVLRAAPISRSTSASRLTSMTVDAFYKVIVIIDASRLGEVSTTALADYVSMVSFAQVADDADFSGSDTILNLFSYGPGELTAWDNAYLEALYASEGRAASAVGQIGEVTNLLRARLDSIP